MKTVKQIADELGVTKAALQKRISREPLRTSLAPYIDTRNGTKYISDIGERLIISLITQAMDTPINLSIDKNIDSVGQNELYIILKNELDSKNQQLAVKDKQIQDLNARLAESNTALEHVSAALTTAQRTAEAAQALHAGTIQSNHQLTGFTLEHDNHATHEPEAASSGETPPQPATPGSTEEEPIKKGFIAYLLEYFQ